MIALIIKFELLGKLCSEQTPYINFELEKSSPQIHRCNMCISSYCTGTSRISQRSQSYMLSFNDR